MPNDSHPYFRRRLEPQGHHVLHGAGQSHDAFIDYARAMHDLRPAIYMTYVGLKRDPTAYFETLHKRLADFPDQLLIPQIGLSMTTDGKPEEHYEQRVAQGFYDQQIEQFCDGLAGLHRPVFLRIGYEFNGHWNGYEPATYIAAWKRIEAAIRRRKLDQVVTVWCTSPDANNQSYMAFYPGDDVVDWWGIDLFSVEHFDAPMTRRFMADALERKYPVMIGECTPRFVGVLNGQSDWDRWFAPYFRFFQEHRHVKATCYIAWNWAGYPQWADWGDGRVWQNAQVLENYRQEMAGPHFLHGNDRAAIRRALSL